MINCICNVLKSLHLLLIFSRNNNLLIKWLVSKETLCCVGGQVKQLVDYQLEVDKGKLTAVANLNSLCGPRTKGREGEVKFECEVLGEHEAQLRRLSFTWLCHIELLISMLITYTNLVSLEKSMKSLFGFSDILPNPCT